MLSLVYFLLAIPAFRAFDLVQINVNNSTDAERPAIPTGTQTVVYCHSRREG